MATRGINVGVKIKGDAKDFKAAAAEAQRATEKLKKGFKGGQTQMQKFGTAAKAAIGMVVAAITIVIAKVAQWATAMKDVYQVQAEAETKLATIVKQRMGLGKEAIRNLIEQAAAYQKIGVIGDEVLLGGLQQLATFTKQKKALENLIPGILNLTAQQHGYNATAEHAVTIANMMGRALTGQLGALTRVGITFTKAQGQVLKYGDELERTAMLTEIIIDNVGDVNEELAKTPLGEIKQTKNLIGDIKEEIGEKLLPTILKWKQFQLAILEHVIETKKVLEGMTSEGKTMADIIADIDYAVAVDEVEKYKEADEEARKVIMEGWEKVAADRLRQRDEAKQADKRFFDDLYRSAMLIITAFKAIDKVAADTSGTYEEATPVIEAINEEIKDLTKKKAAAVTWKDWEHFDILLKDALYKMDLLTGKDVKPSDALIRFEEELIEVLKDQGSTREEINRALIKWYVELPLKAQEASEAELKAFTKAYTSYSKGLEDRASDDERYQKRRVEYDKAANEIIEITNRNAEDLADAREAIKNQTQERNTKAEIARNNVKRISAIKITEEEITQLQKRIDGGIKETKVYGRNVKKKESAEKNLAKQTQKFLDETGMSYEEFVKELPELKLFEISDEDVERIKFLREVAAEFAKFDVAFDIGLDEASIAEIFKLAKKTVDTVTTYEEKVTKEKADAKIVATAKLQDKLNILGLSGIGRRRAAELDALEKTYKADLKLYKHNEDAKLVLAQIYEIQQNEISDKYNKEGWANVFNKDKAQLELQFAQRKTKEKEYLDEKFDLDIKAAKDSAAERLRIEAQYIEDVRALRIQDFDDVMQVASRVNSTFSELARNRKETELSAAGDIAEKREAIERKYFAQQKALALVNIAINTAVEISKALAKPWLIALIAAAGAFQAGVVASQSFPEMAQGGIVSGPTLATVGEYPGARTNPEVIAPLDKLKDMFGNFGGGQVIFEIEGDKLIGVLDNYDRKTKSFA